MTNTNTYVKADTYGSLDWHDISSWSDFLQEDDKFEIKDVFKVIANDIYKRLNKMQMSTNKSEQTTVLKNIPSLEEITECIRDKKTFKAASEDAFALEAYWDPEKTTLHRTTPAARYPTTCTMTSKRLPRRTSSTSQVKTICVR